MAARGRHESRFFQRFVRTEALGGALLFLSATAALVVANSTWAAWYFRLLALPLAVSVGGHALSLTTQQGVNDVLMTLFFLLVGLEIKRELIAGELASPRRAALPIAAAAGGMLVPAALYLAVNHGGPGAGGWGVPMATDIAFAIGTLALIAPRIPTGAKVFLTALAIVDDMGAVVVIAVWYSAPLDRTSLAWAGAALAALIVLNVAQVHRLMPYLAVGGILWWLVHHAGIHSTIAGVLLALTIPARSRIDAEEFSGAARRLLDEFDQSETGDRQVLTSEGQQDALVALRQATEAVTAPSLRLEHWLHGLSALVIMPVFGFANAGVRLGVAPLDWHVILGIILGLAIGKCVGIMAGAVGAVTLKVGALPDRVTWRALAGCAWLGGVGFTMSLFIANLAFGGTPLLDSARLGILAGSGMAAVLALVAFRLSRTAPSSARVR